MLGNVTLKSLNIVQLHSFYRTASTSINSEQFQDDRTNISTLSRLHLNFIIFLSRDAVLQLLCLNRNSGISSGLFTRRHYHPIIGTQTPCKWRNLTSSRGMSCNSQTLLKQPAVNIFAFLKPIFFRIRYILAAEVNLRICKGCLSYKEYTDIIPQLFLNRWMWINSGCTYFLIFYWFTLWISIAI